MRIKIDIDGVIRDTCSSLVEIYNKEFDQHMEVKDILFYDVNLSFPLCDYDAVNFFFVTHAKEVYLDSKPIKDAVDTIRKLKEQNEIILISYQPTQKGKDYTIKWLEKNNVVYDTLVLLNNPDKTILDADWIIDDNPKFLDDDQAKKICVDYPYNRDKDYNIRVKSLKDLLNYFEN